MAIEPDAKNIPDVLWCYMGIVEFMMEHPGMYGSEGLRTKAHDDLCKHFGLQKETTRRITDNLNMYDGVGDVYRALKSLEKGE